MKQEIKVPSVGESVSEAEIESWEKQDGDTVNKGDILVILETDKASMEIPATTGGKLSIVKQKGETVTVGEVIAHIDSSVKPSATSPSAKTKPQTSTPSETPTSTPSASQKESLISPEASLSPAVSRLVAQNKVDLQNIKGTGRGARFTKEDILKSLNKPTSDSPTPTPSSSSSQKISYKDGQRKEPMTHLRKRTAERLVYSQQSTATLSTFNEVDMTNIMEIRKKYKDMFLKKHGVKLGLMGFFVKAVVSALKEYPKIQAFIEGTDIVYNESCHIGIAVSTDKGLVVPVIRNAEQLTLAEIEKQILLYGQKAKDRKLSLDDISGGTFTISNGGIFGSLLSTPILNPPQSGILGMHKIEKRPAVVNDEICIRPMMYLALSYDHRMVDGRKSVGFLVKIKENIEDPTRLLINI